MSERILVLGVAPYEGMKALMQKLAKEYPEIDLSVFSGDLEVGVGIAQDHFNVDYDVIISRGGTAQMLRERFDLPVVEISFTLYDVLRALQLAEAFPGKAAIVGFSNLVDAVRPVSNLLQRNLDVFAVADAEESANVMKQLKQEHYSVVLCDMISNTIAQRMGLNSILIVSGTESIRMAFRSAIALSAGQERLREENRFLRKLIRNQASETVAFDHNNKLYFSSLDLQEEQETVEMLRQEVAKISDNVPQHLLKTKDGILYNIKYQQFISGDTTYRAFFFTRGKSPLSNSRCGVEYLNSSEVEHDFYGSIYSIRDLEVDFRKKLEKFADFSAPVILAGEPGTDKRSAAEFLYFSSNRGKRPLICVDCGLLVEKSWDHLLNHHNSPLCLSNTTLYFHKAENLQSQWQKEFVAALVDMEVCRRNQVIFSFDVEENQELPPLAIKIKDRFRCVMLQMPPLRKNLGNIPRLTNLLLSQLKLELGTDISGMEPEAMQELQAYEWPQNYMQLKNVLRQAAIMDQQIIRGETVRSVLQQERTAVPSLCGARSMQLNLNRPLEQIKCDVVRLVLESENGNQTAAAARLGISRTTLWRMVKEN